MKTIFSFTSDNFFANLSFFCLSLQVVHLWNSPHIPKLKQLLLAYTVVKLCQWVYRNTISEGIYIKAARSKFNLEVLWWGERVRICGIPLINNLKCLWNAKLRSSRGIIEWIPLESSYLHARDCTANHNPRAVSALIAASASLSQKRTREMMFTWRLILLFAFKVPREVRRQATCVASLF